MKMMFRLELIKEAKEGILLYQKAGDTKSLKKLYTLLEELRMQPETGKGEPKRLKHLTGNKWSRKINKKHRLIYEIFDDTVMVLVLKTRDHYYDK